MTLKFITKPVLIDAIQYTAPIYSNIIDFIESFGDKRNDVLLKVWDDPNEHRNISNTSGTSYLTIKTDQGNIKFSHGDFIIRYENGKYQVCNYDTFKNKYEPFNPNQNG